MDRRIRVRSIAATIVLTLAVTVSAGVTGAASNPDADTVRDAAVAWMAPQVTDQGALISPYTDEADPGMTAQAALGMAGSGADPDVVASMIDYLEANVEDYVAPGGADDSPGALAWLILDALATDGDPTDFGGVDLPARLQATQQPDGLFGAADPSFDGTFRQALSLIALSAVGGDVTDGLAWLDDQQCDDGGFVAYRSDTAEPCPAVDPTDFSGPDTNSTAFAAIALTLNGAQSGADAAMDWLQGVRTAGGGFAYLGDSAQEQDANSTGMVLLAFRTVQGEMDAGSVEALASLQVPESGDPLDRGGIAFQAGDPLFPDLMATTQALLGLTGQALPFAPVEPAPSPSTTAPENPDDSGVDPAPGTPGAPPAAPVEATPAYTG